MLKCKSRIILMYKNILDLFHQNYDDNNTIIRLVTDWFTTEEDIDKVIKLF